MIATKVGPTAYLKSMIGLSVPENFLLRIANPAAFGALAIMVSPPPARAPSTNANFELSVKPST